MNQTLIDEIFTDTKFNLLSMSTLNIKYILKFYSTMTLLLGFYFLGYEASKRKTMQKHLKDFAMLIFLHQIGVPIHLVVEKFNVFPSYKFKE